MNVLTSISDRGEVRDLHQASSEFDSRMADESFLKVLNAFLHVGVLATLVINIRCAAPSGIRFGQVQYEVDCTAYVSAVPAHLSIPAPDDFGQPRDLIASFVAAGYESKPQFEAYLGQYLTEVWPAFADVGHLFGGAGQLALTRSDINSFLAAHPPNGAPAETAKAFREFVIREVLSPTLSPESI
jgi:hypothetical protein